MITSSCRHKNSVFYRHRRCRRRRRRRRSTSSSTTLTLKRSLSVDPRKPFVAAASHRNVSRFSEHFRRIRDNSLLLRARSSPHRYRRSTSFADRYLSNKTWTGTLGDEPRPVEPTPTRRPVQHRSAEIGSHSSDSLSSFSTSETSFAEKKWFLLFEIWTFWTKKVKELLLPSMF